MMLTLPAPAALNGATLRDELAAAGVTVPAFGGIILRDEDVSFPDLDKGDRAVVAAVLAAHDGADTQAEEQVPVSVDPDVAADILTQAKIATTIPQLRDALVKALEAFAP